MIFSVLGQAILSGYLPDEPWAPLISKLGYCFGFLIVVVGRMQLFTENTVTAVLPLLAEWSRAHLAHTARLWGVVLLANVVGTFITAALVSRAGLVVPAHVSAMIEVASEFADNTPWSAFLYGIPAGFLIAAIVWVMPSAETARFSIVVWFTYLVAIGDFTHVVVGSAELSLLLVGGYVGIAQATGLLLSTLAGNIVGGTGLFALLAHAQIKEEM
jgi:formate/nitrite transporter FocA (FNT family)